MEKLTLLSINSDGDDEYVVHCLLDRKEASYKFRFVVGAFGDRVLQHEEAFYLETHDDPASEWLEKAIQALDRSRKQARSESRAQPVNLMVEGDRNGFAQHYKATFVDRESIPIKVTEQLDTRQADCSLGTCIAKLEPPGLWITDAKSDPLLQSALMLHQAIFPKYKINSKSL